LLKDLDTKKAILLTGGLQATSASEIILQKMKKIDYLIGGESELIVLEILNNFEIKKKLNKPLKILENIDGISYIKEKKFYQNKKQKIINDLDKLSPYDYDIFDNQSLIRPYNGKIVKAVDYEISRGCIYSCNYCVETIIQKYYGFKKFSSKTGAIKNFKSYLRNKSPKKIFEELTYLNKVKKVELIRCQDTNFLTNDRNVLLELSNLIDKSDLDIKLYIETRPEGIN
jgi:radical SAM superfamily enzyme YgiQ (UPF0313 family)